MLLLYNYYFKAVTRLNESINRWIWITHLGDATKAISVRLKNWRSRRRRSDNYSLIVVFFFLRSFDSLEIINNKNQKFGIYCGLETGRKVTVTGEYVLLIFRSDLSDSERGFWLFFHAVPVGKYLLTSQCLWNVRKFHMYLSVLFRYICRIFFWDF